jgi:hypothetical protein
MQNPAVLSHPFKVEVELDRTNPAEINILHSIACLLEQRLPTLVAASAGSQIPNVFPFTRDTGTPIDNPPSTLILRICLDFWRNDLSLCSEVVKRSAPYDGEFGTDRAIPFAQFLEDVRKVYI